MEEGQPIQGPAIPCRAGRATRHYAYVTAQTAGQSTVIVGVDFVIRTQRDCSCKSSNPVRAAAHPSEGLRIRGRADASDDARRGQTTTAWRIGNGTLPPRSRRKTSQRQERPRLAGHVTTVVETLNHSRKPGGARLASLRDPGLSRGAARWFSDP